MAHLKTHKDIRKYFYVLTNWALLRRKSRSFVFFKYLKVCSSLFKFRMPLHRDPTHGKGRELLIYSLQITDLIF